MDEGRGSAQGREGSPVDGVGGRKDGGVGVSCPVCGGPMKPRRHYCSAECAEGWMLKRSESFQRATNRRGLPDTYGSAKKP